MIEKKYKISFVIPAYNSEDTLLEAVDSIFDGNFEDGDEVIIVNDSSNDNTKIVAENILIKYKPFIKLINNEQNKGCPASRNVGISDSKNELIFNLDSDNILFPGSIKKLKKELIEQNADVSSFQEYHYFKTNAKKITHKWICNTGILTLADFLSGLINPGPGGNFLYKKEIWSKIGGYWEYGKGLHEAWGYALKLLINGAKFIVVPNTFYFHRYSHQSLFMRENARGGESANITNKFIEPALELLDTESREFVKKNNNWFDYMNKKPLYLKNRPLGKNGKLVYTSPIKQILYTVKKILLK
ncbi:MAG: glycosyltransferase family 2 protein [Patescibacteria group bacterium]